jgi:aromatic-L-amino-acid decarboxylase
LSLVAARQAVEGLDSRNEGLAGRPELQRLRIYASEEAHYSVEKAAIVIGVGRSGFRRIPVDAAFRMRPDALVHAIAEDRVNGWQPFCVVGTLGTTSSTSVDPAGQLAHICRQERLWLHLDAAYAGAAALVPEYRDLFDGWEQADSIVFNPHKWMFTPFDASLLLFRDPDKYREAFSLIPEYVKTPPTGPVHNYSEYGVQMGRRFRALKLWMLIRYFGADGIAARIRAHCGLAQEVTSWIETDPDWELLAPVPFATVCFRFRPGSLGRELDSEAEARLDRWNQEILDAVNESGEVFLSHTRLNGRYTLRIALGNPRTRIDHVQTCWQLLRKAALSIAERGSPPISR